MHVIGFDAYQSEGARERLGESANLVIASKGQDEAAQTPTQMWPLV